MRNCWAGGELPILLKKNNGGFLMLALLMWSMARVGGCVRAASSFLSVVHTHAAWGRKDHRKKVAWRRAHVMFFFLSGSFVSVMRGLTSNDPIRSECRLMWWLFYSPCLDGSTTAAYEVHQSTSTDDSCFDRWSSGAGNCFDCWIKMNSKTAAPEISEQKI
jgi:thiol:disulfide interchange protein